jgi:hypothetical protein
MCTCGSLSLVDLADADAEFDMLFWTYMWSVRMPLVVIRCIEEGSSLPSELCFY